MTDTVTIKMPQLRFSWVPLFRIYKQPKGQVLKKSEIEILMGLLEGQTGKEIAHRLYLTEGAIDKAKQRIFHKTGTANSRQLMHWAMSQYFMKL